MGWPFFGPVEAAEQAHFMTAWESRKLLHSRHTGFVLDGHKRCLSQEQSFGHLALIAPTGAGKSTKIVIPNILQATTASLVITDPSGELYALTSGALAQKGYQVRLLDFSQPERSLGWNPLGALQPEQAGEIAHILVRSANQEDYERNKFWYVATEQLLELLLLGLLEQQDSRYLNLHNLLHLLYHVGQPGFIEWVAQRWSAPLYTRLRGLFAGNEKMLQAYLSIAMASLKLLHQESLAGMLSVQELQLSELRQRPTALFVSVPSEKLSYYCFLLNLFYTQVFQTLLQKPEPQALPVFCLLDEAGHLGIPNFATVINIIRKYRVGILAIYQAKSQLDALYGRERAHAILAGGFTNKLVLPGLDAETARWISEMVGETDAHFRRRPLVPADRLRTLPSHEGILLAANHEPIRLKMKPFYASALGKLTKLPALPTSQSKAREVYYLPLE